MKQVAGYLCKYGTNRPIFNLIDEKSTFDMGRRVANASTDMVIVWEQEKKDASSRIEGHWNEVLRKQKLAKELRAEIADLGVKRAEANRKLVNEKSELAKHVRKLHDRNRRYASSSVINAYDAHGHSTCERSVNSLTSTVNSLVSQLNSKNSALQSALKAPLPVLQPLPQDKNNAMPIIFFLYMPPIFQLLSRFSFAAQQLRLPHPWAAALGGREGCEKFDITSQVTRGTEYCQFSWKEYYNTKQYSQYHRPSCSRSGSDYHLLLRSVSNVVPNEVGSKSVDYIHSQNDGIWFPDQLKPRMAWLGGPNSFDMASHREINPFATVDHLIIVANFTERLADEDSALQWTLMQPGEKHIPRYRGNLPYARQNNQPNWMSKTQYLAFANMR